MKSSYFRIALAGLLLSIAGMANATLIVGNSYLDGEGVAWEYVGSFQVSDGPNWSSTVELFNGLEAAEEVFGALADNMRYAISTLDTGFVNHMANYDGYGQANHVLPEDIVTDINGDGFYNWAGNGLGDWSAYIMDHSNNNVNYVFKAAVAVAQVSEPSALAVIALGLMGFAASRARKK
ncbi:PEP-CTERM sorting domain-containing protein [Bowmanella dokdonensis]|uniref:PEP-CTERM sorting domain-containing protein n=1 Tax=Bowmanella dokdonensis TaxID=751969 RepID=A0A939DNV9_9ALTE|nr:PEP-CTERM sorting domain-containing protein [Bowmanella dokdonensis]MBN7826234.1 PEP-CTERM sorting domain-containing protein [Bowmanella dokdonensis]